MALSQKLTDAFNQNSGKIFGGWEFILKYNMALGRAMDSMSMDDRKLLFKEDTEIHRALRKQFEKKANYDELPNILVDGSHGLYRAPKGTKEAEANNYVNMGLEFFLMKKAESQIPDPMNPVIEAAFIEAITKTHDYREEIAAGTLKLRRHYKRFKKEA